MPLHPLIRSAAIAVWRLVRGPNLWVQGQAPARRQEGVERPSGGEGEGVVADDGDGFGGSAAGFAGRAGGTHRGDGGGGDDAVDLGMRGEKVSGEAERSFGAEL